MQQIERYGVMVLLLMLVTILVVSLWDGEVRAAAGPDGPDKPGKSVAVATRNPGRSTPAASNTGPRQAATRQRETRSVPLGAVASQSSARTQQRGQRAGAQRGGERRAEAAQVAPAQDELRTVGTQLPQARTTLPVRSNTSVPAAQQATRSTSTSPVEADPNRSRRARYASGGDSAARDSAVAEAERSTRPGTAQSEPPARPARAASQVWTYEIKPGDTLAGIASRVLGDGQRWREIQNANAGLDPRRLMVGAKISLPGRAGSAAVVSTVTPRTERARPAAASSNTSGKYTVRKGDVLSRVAQVQLGSASRWREIVELNPGLDPNRMHVGTKLVMPGRSATSSPRASSADTSRVAVAETTSSPAADSRYRVR
ncbi:MAG: nucleoid-associated protein YgaU [Chlamydiales bacterium]|jgi:nucleoid-associated protein YgaU